jgi:hypothetical protein
MQPSPTSRDQTLDEMIDRQLKSCLGLANEAQARSDIRGFMAPLMLHWRAP